MSSAVSDPSGQLERISPFTGRGIYSFGHSWELAETRIQDLSSAFVRRLVIFSRVLIAAVGVSLTGLEDERNKQATTAAWRQHLGREQVCVQGCSTGARGVSVFACCHTRVCVHSFSSSAFFPPSHLELHAAVAASPVGTASASPSRRLHSAACTCQLLEKITNPHRKTECSVVVWLCLNRQESPEPSSTAQL